MANVIRRFGNWDVTEEFLVFKQHPTIESQCDYSIPVNGVWDTRNGDYGKPVFDWPLQLCVKTFVTGNDVNDLVSALKFVQSELKADIKPNTVSAETWTDTKRDIDFRMGSK